MGAARAGTTTICRVLEAHPQIYMSPIKEPHYFAMYDISMSNIRKKVKHSLAQFNLDKYLHSEMATPVHRYYISDWDQYLMLFRNATAKQFAGEASPSYLWAPHAAERIKEKLPNAKIIINLRNPVDRAYSHYWLERKMNMTTKKFRDALEEDSKYPVLQWGATPMYIELGMYYDQVRNYLDLFNRQNVFISLFEDLKNDLAAFTNRLYVFLDVDPGFSPETKIHQNKSVLPRHPWLSHFVENIYLKNLASVILNDSIKERFKKLVFSQNSIPKIAEDDRLYLLNLFREDIHRLQDLIKRDLSEWLK